MFNQFSVCFGIFEGFLNLMKIMSSFASWPSPILRVINHGSRSLLPFSFDQETVFNDEDQFSSECKICRWKDLEVHELFGGKLQLAKEENGSSGEQRHGQV